MSMTDPEFWTDAHRELHGHKFEHDVLNMIKWVAHTVGPDLNNQQVQAEMQKQVAYVAKRATQGMRANANF